MKLEVEIVGLHTYTDLTTGETHFTAVVLNGETPVEIPLTMEQYSSFIDAVGGRDPIETPPPEPLESLPPLPPVVREGLGAAVQDVLVRGRAAPTVTAGAAADASDGFEALDE
jgi:hypothetical protein